MKQIKLTAEIAFKPNLKKTYLKFLKDTPFESTEEATDAFIESLDDVLKYVDIKFK